MGETEVHVTQILALFHMLREYLRDRQDTYVAADMFVYYVEGDPQKVVCPDVFVVLGVPKVVRHNYLIWEEGQAPTVVIEVTSASSRVEDLGSKKGLYEQLGVREFYLRLATAIRWPVREVARRTGGALFERLALSPPELSTALRELHPSEGGAFRDA